MTVNFRPVNISINYQRLPPGRNDSWAVPSTFETKSIRSYEIRSHVKLPLLRYFLPPVIYKRFVNESYQLVVVFREISKALALRARV